MRFINQISRKKDAVMIIIKLSYLNSIGKLDIAYEERRIR